MGCLIREAAVADLARAIIAAGRGEVVLPPALELAALARGELRSERLFRRPSEQPSETLTDRETEVMGLLGCGLTNKVNEETVATTWRDDDDNQIGNKQLPA